MTGEPWVPDPEALVVEHAPPDYQCDMCRCWVPHVVFEWRGGKPARQLCEVCIRQQEED